VSNRDLLTMVARVASTNQVQTRDFVPAVGACGETAPTEHPTGTAGCPQDEQNSQVIRRNLSAKTGTGGVTLSLPNAPRRAFWGSVHHIGQPAFCQKSAEASFAVQFRRVRIIARGVPRARRARPATGRTTRDRIQGAGADGASAGIRGSGGRVGVHPPPATSLRDGYAEDGRDHRRGHGDGRRRPAHNRLANPCSGSAGSR